MLLKDCPRDSIISFSGKRKKYRVKSHNHSIYEILPTGTWVDRNFIEHPGTSIKNSSGRLITVKSDREVILLSNN
jgi:hypothetical protein